MNVNVNGKSIAGISPSQADGNALLRESIHAKYSFNNVDFPVSQLRKGANTITLTQTRNNGSACHVMYDYVALEMP